MSSEVKVDDFVNGDILEKILVQDIDPDYFGRNISSSSKDSVIFTPLAVLIQKMKHYFAQQVRFSIIFPFMCECQF